MGERYVPSLIVINSTIKQLDSKVSIMVGDTCVPNLIVIGTVINQLETKVSLKIICYLMFFVVVYKHIMF